MSGPRVLAPLVAALASGLAQAQPTFRAAVDLVTIPVTVTSSAPDTLPELGPEDFRVYEDGVLQPLALVTRQPRALSVCVLLDSSPSMAARQALAIRTVETLIKSLGDSDEVSVLMFATKVWTFLPWTAADEARKLSWYEWRLALGTALIDAMKEALVRIEQAANPVPVIVIVSDGGEYTSSTPLAKLVASRRQSETVVYAIYTEGRQSKTATALNRSFAVNFLPELVGDSGGTIYRARDGATAQTAAESLVRELRSQYTLGYAPRKPLDGTYRRVKVEAVDPTLTVRHRDGYLAARGR